MTITIQSLVPLLRQLVIIKGKQKAELNQISARGVGRQRALLKLALGGRRQAYHFSLQDTAIPRRWRGRPSLKDAEQGAGRRKKGEGASRNQLKRKLKRH